MKPRRRSLANIEYFRQNAMESLLKSVQMRKSNLSQDFPSRLVRRRCTISEIKYENKVEPDSPAEREDIRVGDKLIRANGTRLDQLPHREMQRVLQESRGHTELVLLRRTKSMDSREFRPEVSSPSHNLEKKQKEVFLVKAIENEKDVRAFLLSKLADCTDDDSRARANREYKESETKEDQYRRQLLSLGAASEGHSEGHGLKTLSLSKAYGLILFLFHRNALNKLLYRELYDSMLAAKKDKIDGLIDRIYRDCLSRDGGITLYETEQNADEEENADSFVKDIEKAYHAIEEYKARDDSDPKAALDNLRSLVDHEVQNYFEAFEDHLQEEQIKNPGMRHPENDEILKLDDDFIQYIQSPTSQAEATIQVLWEILRDKLPKNSVINREAKKRRTTSMFIPNMSNMSRSFSSISTAKESIKSLFSETRRARDKSYSIHVTSPLVETTTSETPSRPVSMDQETIEQAEEMKQEIEPITPEFQILPLIPWIHDVKQTHPEFDLSTVSKEEQGRQMVIHELINVHHNASAKVTFIKEIFKPKVLELTPLKEGDAVCESIFRNIEETKDFFDDLRDRLEARKVEDGACIRGLGDILFAFFDLEKEHGKQFQSAMSSWVSRDSEFLNTMEKMRNMCGPDNPDPVGFFKAIGAAEADPRLNRLKFGDIMMVIFQTLPRYPMLLAQLLKYTEKVGDELNDEKQLLNKAQNAIQLTVAEINKRAGEEQLLSRINQILQYQNVGDFRKYVSKIKDDDRDNADLKNFGELKHHLDIHQIIKFGDCKVQTMLTRPGKKASDSDAMYFLLNEWLVFFVQNKKLFSILKMDRTFFVFPIKDVHIRQDQTNKNSVFLLHLRGLQYKLQLPSSDESSDLELTFKAQKALIVPPDTPRLPAHRTSGGKAAVEDLENAEEEDDDSESLREAEQDAVPINISQRLDSGPPEPPPRRNRQGENRVTEVSSPITSDAEDAEEDFSNSRIPSRSSRARTTVRRPTTPTNVDNNEPSKTDLLEEHHDAIEKILPHLTDSDEALDAFERLKLTFLQMRNSFQ